MSGKLAIGGLVAVAVMALSTNTASAQHRGGYHYGGGGGYYGGYAPVYRPVYAAPIYRPVYTSPFPVYNSGFGFASPAYGGYTSGFGFGTPNLYGGSYNTLNFGVYRPGVYGNFGVIIR